MQPDKTLEIKSAVITLKLLHEGTLVSMDKSGSLRKLDVGTYKTTGGFKTKIEQERFWGNHMSVSASGKYAVNVIPHTNKAALYDIEARKLLYTTSRHKGDLESVCVDDNGHYLVTGGTDGKTYVWNIDTKRLAYSFPAHADYITALQINNTWIASASYDRNISVLNLRTMKTPIRLNGHASAVIQMRFLSNMKMLSIDKEGNIILWDLKKGTIIRRFVKLNDDVTCFEVSADERFVFVGTKLGRVSLYLLETGEQLKRSFIKETSKITALCLLESKGQLVVGTKNGLLSFYSLLPDNRVLLGMLKDKAYDELYNAAKENPLIYYSPVYFEMEELWNTTLNKATKMLETGQKTDAMDMLETFNKVSSKRSIIQELLKEYREFEKFSFYVEDKRFSLAYPMANRHKHFKNSDAFLSMEKQWHTSFNKAKAYLMHKDGEEKIRKLLSNFKGISEKSILIQDLFKQRTAYTLLQKKLAQKDYKAIFALLQKCPFIKEFDEYDKLLEYADDTYINAQRAFEREDYSKAVSYATELMHFPDFKDEAKAMIDHADTLEKFTLAFASNNMDLMYEMIGEFPFLEELEEVHKLEEDWNHHLVLAEKYASKADVLNAIGSLEDFFEIKAKFMAIAVVMQQAYIAQLNRALRTEKSKFAIESGIRQYIGFFGMDDHIENYIENYIVKFQSDLELSRLQKGDIQLFRPSMIIHDIVK